VAVVGGGIVGLAAARELAGRGLAVTVIERGGPGCQASSAAAGMLAPLSEVPEPGPLFDACRAARDGWTAWAAELEAETGRSIGHDTDGALAVARDDEEAAGLARLAAAAAELGEPTREISLAEARRLVPDLAADVRSVLHLPGDHRVDNVATCGALAAAVRGRGVALRTGTAVERVEAAGGGTVRLALRGENGPATLETGALVVAAGAWSGSLPGLPALPVAPVRGQMMSIAGVDWPWQGTVRAGDRYAVRRALASAVRRADTLLVGATVDDAGFEVANSPAGLADLAAFVRRLFPALAERPVRSIWAGLRPGTADGLPILGPLPEHHGVFLATGHHRNGILLAPWTAERVAAMVADGAAPEGAAAFAPERFLRARESV
jgi:glycine oxidase